MSSPLPHRIRRLTWQARAPTADAAFALRALLREAGEPALAALERSLSAHAPADRVIHLPRLELHLRVDPQLAADELPARIAAAAAAALGELDGQDAAAPPSSPPPPASPSSSTAYPPSATQPRPAAGQHTASAATPAVPPATLTAATALAIDALLRHDPGEVQAALGAALREAGTAAAPTIALHLHGRRWTLPVAGLPALATQLATRLASHAAPPDAARSATAAPADRPPPAPPSPAPPARIATPPAGPAAPGDSLPLHLQASLAGYLQQGSVDWTLAGLAADRILQLLRDAALVWARLGSVPASLFALPATARPGALVRWLALLPPASRSAVASALTPAGAAACAPLAAALRALLAAAGTEHQQLHAQALWLAWTMESGHDSGGHAAWCRAMLAWLGALPGLGAASPAWQAVVAQLQASGPAAAPPHADATPPSSLPAPGRRAGISTAAPPPAARNPPPAAEPAAAPWPAFDARQPAATPAGCVVPAAGLVLLHPYLPRLLDATGLHPAVRRGPIAEPQLPAAAGLLHWLASGSDTAAAHEFAHEFELPFIKLLLGRDPDTPLPHAPPPPDGALRDEGAALLDAVLAHWQALRGTSVAGLRTSFLQRRGHLERRDDAWRLRVEAESFDILLGLLPWGLGLVRLPWMAQPLLTEWATP